MEEKMRTHALVLVTAFAAAALVAACGDDNPTPPQTTTTFTAALSSSNEINNDGTSKNLGNAGSGTATFTMTGTHVEFTVSVAGLTGPATASHIHVGSASQNGAIVLPFTIVTGVTSGNLTNGSFDVSSTIPGATISADSLMKLFNNGNAYVNVHTQANPAGEMRGQVTKQ
jgi:hypothetical protein